MNFEFDFTPEKLAACIRNPQVNDWYQPIVDVLPRYEITTVLRVAMWFAQMGHESGDLREIEENLNYSAKGLLGVFPRYFPTDELALAYQRKPEMIANRVYGNRMGNGDEQSGDGFRFHGRGLVQITGKENYTHCSQAMYDDLRLLDTPDLLCEQDGAIRSACWYWNSRQLNQWADLGDVVAVTKKINGGTIGLDDRTARYHHALAVLNS